MPRQEGVTAEREKGRVEECGTEGVTGEGIKER